MLLESLQQILNGHSAVLGERSQAAIRLVEHIADLTAQRQKITAEIDAAIERAIADLNRLTGRTPSQPETLDQEELPEDATKQDRVLAFLRTRPGAPYPELAQAVYGKTDEKTMNRVRSVVYTLRKEGHIHPTKMEVLP